MEVVATRSHKQAADGKYAGDPRVEEKPRREESSKT